MNCGLVVQYAFVTQTQYGSSQSRYTVREYSQPQITRTTAYIANERNWVLIIGSEMTFGSETIDRNPGARTAQGPRTAPGQSSPARGGVTHLQMLLVWKSSTGVSAKVAMWRRLRPRRVSWPI